MGSERSDPSKCMLDKPNHPDSPLSSPWDELSPVPADRDRVSVGAGEVSGYKQLVTIFPQPGR